MRTIVSVIALLVAPTLALAEYEFPKESEPYVSAMVTEASVAQVRNCTYLGTVKEKGADFLYAVGDDLKKAESMKATHMVVAYVIPSVGVVRMNTTVVADVYRCPK